MTLQNSSMCWLRLSVLLLGLDQASKHLISKFISMYQSISISSFFNLVCVHNYGAAFDLLSNEGGWQRWLFTITAVAISVLFVWYLKCTPAGKPLISVGYALVIGGALSNVIDRLIMGYVIDFIDLYWKDCHWPAFNIADSCICVGSILLAIDSFLYPSLSNSDKP